MTRPRRPFWRDPVDVVNAFWSAAALFPPVSTGAAAAYRTLYMTARRAVLGRTLTVPLGGSEVQLRVIELSSRLDPRRLALGMGEDVWVTAEEIHWQHGIFDRATALLRNVQLRPGAPPTLRAQTVELSVEFGSDALAQFLASTAPRWTGDIDDTGALRLRWARRPRWINVEVGVTLDGDGGTTALWFHPRALGIGTRRWRLPGRTPAHRMAITAIPPHLRVTGVRLEPELVRVDATVARWHAGVPTRFLPLLPG